MEPKTSRLWILAVVGLLVVGAYFFFGSRAGRETAEAVDGMAEEVTGSRALRQGEEIKGQLRQITTRRAEQMETVRPK